ncbi:DUF2851 family protein [Rosettibacter firmus]|uniref:DUF2851 family protein n=1 Tax=Rosettibacter firmus TaxID=3111522 RepID=UPI00336BED43
MGSVSKVQESKLYEIWQKQNFNDIIKTSDEYDIFIIDKGNRNEDSAGPDFRNARIRIGNLTYVGDVEIDLDYSDWKAHGHNIDNKYNSVILHVTLTNKNRQGYVYTKNGRKVPSICISDLIHNDLIEQLKNSIEQEEKSDAVNLLKCTESIHLVPFETKEKFLIQLGVERFNKKCKRIYERLKELQFLKELNIKEPVVSYELTQKFHERQFKHSDFTNKEVWQQLFYELVFEALGYSKNKSQMITLAQYANVDFLKKIEKDGVLIQKYEAALMNISGLINSSEKIIDEESKNYLDNISLHWNSIKVFYDSKYMNETQWHFFRLRPQNFPTIRIAAGARLLKEILHEDLISVIAKKIAEIQKLTVLINSLRSLFVIKSDGYWKTHYVFNQPAKSEIKYFVGATRADEIVINVVLPFFAVYFEMFGNKLLPKKIMKIYSIYEQKSENQIITDVGNAILMKDHINRTIISQGIIDLFRSYCSKGKCLECEIGKVAFN